MRISKQMRGIILSLLLVAAPAAALNEGLQCVPYARALSGVSIFGDAHTWWNQADGRYGRGASPKVGAVLAFPPHGNMRLGHVAAVRRIVDNRTIIISHANWSTIGGVRGHIEEDVRAIDVSEANDWSRVRVWYTPNEALGTTEWPAHGFIYPKQTRNERDARKAVAILLKDRLIPNAPTAQPVRLAVAFPPAVKATFGLSKDVLKDIDRKARNESAPPPASGSVRLASVEKRIAKLPKS